MKKDSIEKMFKSLEGDFDVYVTPIGHQKRFLDKLNEREKVSKAKRNWWKPLSIAASILILIAAGALFFKQNTSKSDLASVSPEMQKTQFFFTSTINLELQTLKSFTSPEAKNIIADALIQLDNLEKKYEGLEKDLSESGNDQRVIYAMISNFQRRIELLQQVIEKIEEIKILKTNKHETTI